MMLPYPVAHEMLYFDIPAAQLNDVVAWVLLSDEIYMRHEIETKGFAIAIRLEGRTGLKRITEVPAVAGTADPFYGNTGGAHRFLFNIEDNGVRLRAEHHFAETANIPPYEVYIDVPAHFESHAVSSSHWNSNSLGRMIRNRNYNYSMFIDGEMYENMLATGWQKEDAGNYQYEFIPTTVGCIIRIHNLIDGQSYDLTANIDW